MSDRVVLEEYGTSRPVRLSHDEVVALQKASEDRLIVTAAPGADSYTVTATSWVGAVSTPAISVLIRPKVELHNLFYMLGVDPPDFSRSEFRLASDQDLLAIMAIVFTQQVDRSTARGVVRGYRHTEERLLAPRGRIDLVEQLRSPGLVSPIACRFDEYTADVFPNRVMLAALERLQRVPGLAPMTRTSMARLRQRFDGVSPEPVSLEAVRRWTPNRLNQHYRTVMRLAELVLSNLTLADQAGRFASSSFLLDMNELFQTFVATGLAERLDPIIAVAEEPPVHLAEQRRLRMAPDLVMRVGRRDAYVGDMKYKLSSGRGRMSDYYQLLAYTTALSLTEGVLIYAQDPGDSDDPSGDERVHTARVRNADKVLHVYRLFLSGTNKDLENAMDDLADWIETRVRFDGLRRVPQLPEQRPEFAAVSHPS